MVFENLYPIFIYFILLLIINFNYIISKENSFSTIQPKHLEKLYKICKEENNIICSITEAIKYSLYSIKTESKSYLDINCTDVLCLKYEKVYTPNIICEDVDIIIEKEENKNIQPFLEDGKNLISFSNCTVIVIGDLIINDEEEKEIFLIYKNFLSEIYFTKINFYQNQRSAKGELNISFEYDETFKDAFNYDKTDTIFEMDEYGLKQQMDIILKEVFENYTNILESKIDIDENTQIAQIKYFNEIINKFAKQYSLLNSDIEDNENNITYIAYNDIKYTSFINIKNRLFIPNLSISFEYALNYNITYNEGEFSFENVTISRDNYDDYFGNITSNKAEFNDIICEEDTKLIWNVINNDFYNNYIKYK